MKPGDVLRDRYELVSVIGRGGMGDVFHAVHLETGANVAIKVVSRAFIGDLLMARLEREAAAAARIQSPFIPRMLEVDRTTGEGGGELFLVMELLQGESLSERLKRNGGMLSWDEARLIGDNVLQALIAAHAAGVVHRDLKPGNIFIETIPAAVGSAHRAPLRARILDFGVCKLDAAVEGEKLTVTGESVGTIAYMAPEQIRGASKVDERADLYSFAMVIFEIVSGRLAYDAAGQMALLASKLESHARLLSSCVQTPVPRGLDLLIDKALARDPVHRQSSATEVLAAWRALGPATSNSVTLPIVSHAAITTNPPTQIAVTAGTELPSGGLPNGGLPSGGLPNSGLASRASLVVAVVAIIASLFVGVSAIRHRGRAPDANTSGNVGASPAELVTPEPDTVTSPVDPPSGRTAPATGVITGQTETPTGVITGQLEPSTGVITGQADTPPADYEIVGDDAGVSSGDPRDLRDLRARSSGHPHPRQQAIGARKPPPAESRASSTEPAIIEKPHY